MSSKSAWITWTLIEDAESYKDLCGSRHLYCSIGDKQYTDDNNGNLLSYKVVNALMTGGE